uniref:FBA_2 domain-containing protein n=1 Tax=Caenorhabditis tropicalis TaxID=1561998 RepID=A0A1I7V0C4_9PELO
MIGDFLLESDRINTERFRLFNGLEEKRDEFLNTEDRDAAGFWLKHANPHYLKSFTVYMDDAECSLASSGENLRYAETVHILRKSDIDDRILNQLTALDIELESSRITFKGINHLIKVCNSILIGRLSSKLQKWIDQNVPLGSRFVYYNDNMENFSLDKLILNNHLPVESSNNKAIFLLASNKVLHVWVDNSSVYVECMKRK